MSTNAVYINKFYKGENKMDNYSEGLATGMALRDNNCAPYYGMNNSGFGFGGEWGGLIGLLIVASLFGGNGWGFGGNRSGNCATQADLASGFSTSEIMSDLNDILLQNSQGFASVQQTLCQGFSGVNATVNTVGNQINQGICTLGYNIQGGFNDISHQISDCCCTTQRAIDSVKYENAKNTCDIIRAGQDNTRAILDYLSSEKISALQAENAGLKAQISNDRQTATIIGSLTPKCPEPAYIVPNPNSCYDYRVAGVGYGSNGCCSNF